MLCTRFPGDGEIDYHHPPTNFTRKRNKRRSGEKPIDLQSWEVGQSSVSSAAPSSLNKRRNKIFYFIFKTDDIGIWNKINSQ